MGASGAGVGAGAAGAGAEEAAGASSFFAASFFGASQPTKATEVTATKQTAATTNALIFFISFPFLDNFKLVLLISESDLFRIYVSNTSEPKLDLSTYKCLLIHLVRRLLLPLVFLKNQETFYQN
ncbi:hypothetical protein [Desulforegula conservatrix]|uniref:hypothetical protein n=1 Tax=Desulforegula conservatrix TaxID=153026 RepID=UPI0012EC81FE|nr:hypothetical protein [Desulforegula conservatrix]